MINRVVLVGRLTKDVEAGKTQSGLTMATFTVACNRAKKKDEQEQKADFIRCIAWRQSAEFMEQYGRKGMLVAVDGRIQTGSYEKDGFTFYTTDVLCDNVKILETRNSNAEPRNMGNESHTLREYADSVSQDFGTENDPYAREDGDFYYF